MKRFAAVIALLVALSPSVSRAASCVAGTPGTAAAGFCIPFFVFIDPSTGLPLGTTSNPLTIQNAPSPNPAGGLSTYRVNSPAGAGGVTIKSSAGRIYAFDLCNTAPATRYVRFYDSTAPVPGTTPVYAGAIAISAGSCQQFNTAVGLSLTTGIGMSITAANGDSDTTAVTAGDVTGFVGYQ